MSALRENTKHDSLSDSEGSLHPQSETLRSQKTLTQSDMIACLPEPFDKLRINSAKGLYHDKRDDSPCNGRDSSVAESTLPQRVML